MVRKIRHSESGFAMLLSLVVMLVISLITLAIANLALSEYATAKSNEHAMQAFFLADGGLDRALAVLGLEGDWSDTSTSWQPLTDPYYGDSFGLAIDRPFPTAPPSWTYSIYVKNTTGTSLPGGLCAGFGSGLDPVNNVWVRVIGRVGRASRTIEFLAHRLTAGDMTTYSANDVVLNDPTATGAGNVEVHGSLYVRGSLGIKAVKTGIYNDRPLFSIETDPYCNQLWVKGTLDMTKGNPTVGTPAQPMWGVHAAQILLKRNQYIYTRSLDNDVPDIPYPDVQGYVNGLKATQEYANALSGNDLIICHKDDGTFDPSPLTSANLQLGPIERVPGTPDATPHTYYFPTRDYWNTLSPQQCGPNLDTAPNAWVMKWECPAYCRTNGWGYHYFNSDLKDHPVLVNGKLIINLNVRVEGMGTIVVDYPDQTKWAMDSGDSSGKDPTGTSSDPGPCLPSFSCQILTTTPASQGFACPTSTSMPCQDLAVFIVNGNVRLSGSSTDSNQENDVIIVAGDWDDPGDPSDPVHLFVSTKRVVVYGIVIANKLDTSQNPDFRQVADIANYMPFPLAQLLGSSGGSVIVRVWREIY